MKEKWVKTHPLLFDYTTRMYRELNIKQIRFGLVHCIVFKTIKCNNVLL